MQRQSGGTPGTTAALYRLSFRAFSWLLCSASLSSCSLWAAFSSRSASQSCTSSCTFFRKWEWRLSSTSTWHSATLWRVDPWITSGGCFCQVDVFAIWKVQTKAQQGGVGWESGAVFAVIFFNLCSIIVLTHTYVTSNATNAEKCFSVHAAGSLSFTVIHGLFL